uniref:Transposase n=1 Tax=Panagrolaimus sp. JU765 TaxID=591449 RepID=A0AC34R8Q5_9BILA
MSPTNQRKDSSVLLGSKIMAEPIFDENNNSEVDFNAKLGFIEEIRDDVRDDVSNVSEAGSGKACSISTTSVPPEDPEKVEVESDPTPDKLQLQCEVKKLQAEVDTLKNQLSRLNVAERWQNGPSNDDQTKQERERCVVFKCIPQAHVANGLFLTRICEFFKLPTDELSIQITDQLNKWCVVVLHTRSKHDSTTILRKFADFRKLYHCYHRTQALPCFSTAERQKYQQLWAEAIERNNREGFRHWEVDAQQLRLMETVGIPQKWRVKIHYFPDFDSPTASTSAIEVRRRQRDQQSPKLEKLDDSEEIRQKNRRQRSKTDKKRGIQQQMVPGHSVSYEGYECVAHPYGMNPAVHYLQQTPQFAAGYPNYYFQHGLYNGMPFYGQPIPTDSTSLIVDANSGV